MNRELLEQTAFAAGSPLRVDKEAGIIFGVRALGPESRNTYGVPGVDATEYTESARLLLP